METGNLKKKELFVVRTRLIQKNSADNKNRDGLKNLQFGVQMGLLFLSAASVCEIFTSSFSISFHRNIVYPVLFLYSILFCFYYNREPGKKMRTFIFVGGIITLAVILYVLRSHIRAGVYSILNDMITQINRTYSGTIGRLPGVEGEAEYVILPLLFIITWFIAKGIVDRRDNLHFLFLSFPLLLCSVLGGGRISKLSLVILLICFLCMTIAAGLRIRRKFWGGIGTQEYKDNRAVGRRIDFRLTILSTVVLTGVMIISFYVIRPGLSVPLDIMSDAAGPVKTEGIRFLQEFVPKISGGKLQFTAEGVGGGGSQGILGDIAGTFYSREETLKITCISPPTETIYLKGYIGTEYTGNRWLEGKEDKFLEAAKHFNTKGNPSLYIQNLPFLRMMYALNNGLGEGTEAAAVTTEPEAESGAMTTEAETKLNNITVERFGDTISYTYVPYQAYLNDYYRIMGGDGAVAAQTTYEDTYAFFSQETYRETMEQWVKQKDKDSALDKTAIAYEDYVFAEDTKTGNADLDMLWQLCEDKKKEWDNKFKEGMTTEQIEDLTKEKYKDIKNFVRKTLWENCTFKAEAKKLPKGKDFIQYFMFDVKEGDSTAFASAAVIMFRMFGIPARYVEGYTAPVNIFSDNGAGGFSAVLQDDNAHAWAEIYVPGIGWECIETTPGFDGTISNVEMPEEETKDVQDNKEDEKQKDKTKQDKTFRERVREFLEDDFIKCIVLLGVILGILSVRCFIIRRLRRGLVRKMTSKQRIKTIFYSFYEALLFAGLSDLTDVTEDDFLIEVMKMYPDLPEDKLRKYMEIILSVHFGPGKAKEKDVEFSLEMYENLIKTVSDTLNIRRKIVFYFWRAF